jgi:ligand-binding sensor domain-containing protein
MNKICCLFLSLLIYSIQAHGQSAQSELEASIKAGIDPYFVETRDTVLSHGPQCIVRDVLQDRKGNFWMATWNGIIKYDGKVFTNYTLKEGLIHFHVFALFEDSKGNLWFSTARGGVYRYDGKSFRLFTKKDGLADNTTNAFAEDRNGTMWFGTESGLSSYDGKAFTNFFTQDGLSDNNVNSLARDKTGTLWIGTAKGINRYDGKSFTEFTGIDGLPFQRVASLFEDDAGNIWIGSNAKQAGGKGLCRYDGHSVSECISPGFVMYIRQDRNGNLLLAHNDYPRTVNFTLYNYDGKTFSKIFEQTEPPGNPAIFGMIGDRNGNVWFGTAKGVCRYDGKAVSYL